MRNDPQIDVLAEAGDVARAVDLVRKGHPDVALIAEWFPGPLGGLEAAREIRQKAPETSVLMLVLPAFDHDLLAGVRAGVRGYIAKRTNMRQLPTELRRAVAEGTSPLSAELSEELFAEVQEQANAGPDALTSREQEVLELVRRGLSNREVADALSLSVSTVKTHVHAVLRKLGCTRRAQLIVLDRH